MVRYNWEEKTLIELGEKHPKHFKKETRNWIKQNTLDYIKRYGKSDWVSISDLFRDIIYPTDVFKSPTGNFWFASQGVKAKINSTIFLLRSYPNNYPIISGKGKKGYRYADWDIDDVADVWDEKLSGWHERKNRLIKEYKLDIELAKKVLKKLIAKGKEKEAKKLQEVLVRYVKEGEKIEE